MSPIQLIISREYYQRVRRKSFIITTLLMPIFMVGMMAAPALIETFSSPSTQQVTVVDTSGVIAPTLQNNATAQFTIDQKANEKTFVGDESADALLVIDSARVDGVTHVTLYSREAVPLELESTVRQQIVNTLETRNLESDPRLKDIGVTNLRRILDEATPDVQINTVRISVEDESSTSSVLAAIIGIAMTFILYMFMLIYGQLVMNSIIEEKNNRVLEIVVSSISPTRLMIGKIVGIGLVAVTQVLIWIAIIAAVCTWVMPSLISTAMGVNGDAELGQILSMLGDTGYIVGLFGWLLLFLIGGFLFYASIYAAVGSAVDNVQDAGQLSSIATIPILLALVFSMSIASDPNSTLSLWLSYIPFTSPMVMMERIPFGIPTWQIVTSLAVLYASFMLMVWLAAKIYRVGIFMYGKKPTIAELIRWARYK